LSDDGRYGVTVIAFIGSVFSPYYARARRRGFGNPYDHCAFNVVLYGPRGKRWAMTERDRHAVATTSTSYRLGHSEMRVEDGHLALTIDETCVPIPYALRGRIRLTSNWVGQQSYSIDTAGRHVWRPLMPAARIEVDFSDPKLSWSGHGYFDHNRGTAPLESDFARWTWTRLPLRNGDAIFYDTTLRGGENVTLALRYDRHGAVSAVEPPPQHVLPRTGWRIDRSVRSEVTNGISVRTLEDTPFYARSSVSTTIAGEHTTGMHESLSLERFASPWVQAMLPFRMPRRKSALPA
jgi:carotenoid 1,2-hydratase